MHWEVGWAKDLSESLYIILIQKHELYHEPSLCVTVRPRNLTVVILVKKLISFLGNPNIHYLVHKRLLVHSILIQYNYDKYDTNKQNITYCYCIVIILLKPYNCHLLELYCHNYIYTYDKYNSKRGTRWRSWLMHCAKSRKVGGSIPDGVIGIFIDLIFPAAVWPWSRLRL